jgi:hypothetical protein
LVTRRLTIDLPPPSNPLNRRGHIIEKPSVTSSICYEAMKNDSILLKLSTNVDWTMPSVTTCSILNFILQWQRGDVSNLPSSLFCSVFSTKMISNVATSLWIDRSKGFSVLVSRYLTFDLGPFLASLMFKIILLMRGSAIPSYPRKRKSTSLVYQPRDVFFEKGRRRKVITFFINILQT